MEQQRYKMSQLYPGSVLRGTLISDSGVIILAIESQQSDKGGDTVYIQSIAIDKSMNFWCLDFARSPYFTEPAFINGYARKLYRDEVMDLLHPDEES